MYVLFMVTECSGDMETGSIVITVWYFCFFMEYFTILGGIQEGMWKVKDGK
ncbi:hypothetical protein [Desulfosporosinus hippei]|uniref:hypothetical protein n=1 Tax=Desulfosporosinus hippei TaxID=569859 RepID=UPI0015A1C1E8|nr:hypothetical protein [Desulfosporosinus hippei]